MFGAAAGLAALLKGIRFIRAQFCDAQHTTGCGEASIRSAALPDIRAAGKFVRSYEASRWYGVAVPRNKPLEVVDKLNREINLLIEARLRGLGSGPFFRPVLVGYNDSARCGEAQYQRPRLCIS